MAPRLLQFELDWTDVTEGRMSTPAIVEHLDVSVTAATAAARVGHVTAASSVQGAKETLSIKDVGMCNTFLQHVIACVS